MKIKALKAFTVYDSQTKDFLSIGHGQIAEVDSDLAAQLISAGLAEEVTEGAGGNIAAFVDGSITKVTADMLQGATSIRNNIFRDCTSLTEITIPSGVTSIGERAFYGCTSLTTATIPEGATSIGSNAFYECTSLIEITIPSSVTSVGSFAFQGCTSLVTATISEGATSFGGGDVFRDCTALTEITIPSSVTRIPDGSFNGCTSLATAMISEGATYIGENSFRSCTSLTTITVLATTPPTLKDNAFYNTGDDLVIYVPAESVEAYKAATNWSDYASEIQPIPAEEGQS